MVQKVRRWASHEPILRQHRGRRILHSLIQNAADNQWLLFRAQRRFDEIEWHIDDLHADCWPPEYTQKFSLFQRYLGAAERAFYRALQVLEKYRKDHATLDQRAAEHEARLELTAAKAENVKADTAKTESIRELLKILQTADVAPKDSAAGYALPPNIKKRLEKCLSGPEYIESGSRPAN